MQFCRMTLIGLTPRAEALCPSGCGVRCSVLVWVADLGCLSVIVIATLVF